MADGDGDDDGYVFPFRRRIVDSSNQKESSQWSESCYGIWVKDANGDGNKKEPVCFGINIVHITKRVLNSKITPSTTRGVQIVVEEMAKEDEKQFPKRDETIGEDGMIAYRAPKIKRPKKDDELLNQPTLVENIVENFQQKATNIHARYEKYQNDPAAMKGMLYEMKDGLYKQYETGKRILSYVKPSEKLIQLNTFFCQHYEEAINWFHEKVGK